ncbi:hypothetical protein BKH43_02155 [Helicobacter sp. 13S00401-1]|nr:hypothetical protein BKH43_02155 [Helicobacter sp. 13S00401-1]
MNATQTPQDKKALKSFSLFKPLDKIFYKGSLELLKKPLFAIIGSRSPNVYAKEQTAVIASKLAKSGFNIISGGALGIDCIAHENSFPNTIAVLPCSLDLNYPAQNKKILDAIKKDGLALSEYEANRRITLASFLERNRIIIALSDLVFIPYADLQSGSSSSASLALALNKPIFTLPHKMTESLCTQKLLAARKANAIYDVDEFIKTLGLFFDLKTLNASNDEVLEFIRLNPSIQKAQEKFGALLFEYELDSKITRVGLNYRVN